MISEASHLITPILLALIAPPLIFKWVPPNRSYGFRTARTLADTDLWYRANQFCGWALLLASVVSIILLVALPLASDLLTVLIEVVAPVLLAVAASYFYLGRAASE